MISGKAADSTFVVVREEVLTTDDMRAESSYEIPIKLPVHTTSYPRRLIFKDDNVEYIVYIFQSKIPITDPET